MRAGLNYFTRPNACFLEFLYFCSNDQAPDFKDIRMSVFNRVFLVVKRHCGKQKNFAELHSFEDIARDANVPLNKLKKYLDHLQELGLIKYSMAASDQYIYLTSLGKTQEALVNA
jgi:hypothetical protein